MRPILRKYSFRLFIFFRHHFAICLLIGILTLGFAPPALAKLPINIIFTGTTNPYMQKNVDNALKNMLTWLPIPNVDAAVKHFELRAPDRIKLAMEPYGYFHSTVESQLTKTNGQWFATFKIIPGPPVIITTAHLQITGPGQHDPLFEQYQKTFPIQRGQILKTYEYENAKAKLMSIASDYGYFSGKLVLSKILVNLNTNKAEINIHFETGPRYAFGKTSFSPSPFAESFLNKFLTYKRGEYYDNNKVTTTQNNLTNSPYFAQVTINPELSKAQHNEAPMHVALVTQPKKQYIFGAGYGTDTGVRGTLGISLRYLNQYGHRFKMLVQGSQENSQAIASYFIPGRNPATDQWAFTGALSHILQTNGNSNAGKFSINYTTQWLGWRQTYSLNYLDERYTLQNFPRTDANLLYPSIDWSRLYLDNARNPKNGYTISFQLAGTPASFGPTADGFFQGRANINTLYSLTNNTRILLRGNVGHTTISTLSELPLSLQLFTGGARSVRGYTFNSIGPGRNLFAASAEIQERVYGNWYVGLFYDVGNVANNNLFQNMNEGVGPAIIWLSPVGALELSTACAISEPNHPWKIQFSMGPVL